MSVAVRSRMPKAIEIIMIIIRIRIWVRMMEMGMRVDVICYCMCNVKLGYVSCRLVQRLFQIITINHLKMIQELTKK